MNEAFDVNSVIEKIAQQELGITLETQHSDDLDFHDISVWKLRDALKMAYAAGIKRANLNAGFAESYSDMVELQSTKLDI